MPLDFGSGYSLDRNLDFAVSRRHGDIRHDENLTNLLKDISFKLYTGTDEYDSLIDHLGRMLDRGQQREVQMDVVGIIESDQRIVSVTEASVEQSDTETLEVTVSAVTVGEQADIDQYVVQVTA